MKEPIMAEMAEVIAFLIEHYQDFDDCPPPDDLGQILEDVGFDDFSGGALLAIGEFVAALA